MSVIHLIFQLVSLGSYNFILPTEIKIKLVLGFSIKVYFIYIMSTTQLGWMLLNFFQI